MSEMLNTAQRLRNVRFRLGLSQAELANRMGISRNYLSMIEGGKEPSNPILHLINLLEKDADALKRPDPGKAPKVFSVKETPAEYGASKDIRAVEGLKVALVAEFERLPNLDGEEMLRCLQSISGVAELLRRKLGGIEP